MNRPFEPGGQHLAANKISFPRLDSGHYLVRHRLVRELEKGRARGRRVLYVQGQPGQGKSSLVAQYLARTEIPFAWYQLGPEDGDPVFLLCALLEGLRRAYPGFHCPLLEQMLEKGEMAAGDTPRFATVLVSDLCRFVASEVCLVFDDLHLLDDSPVPLAFLNALAAAAPAQMQIVFISRGEFPDGFDFSHCQSLKNADLALSRAEIAELFNSVLNVPLSAENVNRLHQGTEGWVMGLVLAGQTLTRYGENQLSRHLPDLEALKQGRVLGYFEEEALSLLPDTARQALLKLSLLEEIPLSLAQQLTAKEDVRLALDRLVKDNLFVRPVGKGDTFVLHHLFRDSLRELARRSLPRQEQQEILSRSAFWHVENGRMEEGLRYYLEAREYGAAQELLRRIGLDLCGANRLQTLRTVLEQIPENLVREHAWLAYFYGVSHFDIDPPLAHTFLEEARAGFVARKDELGELLAASQEIFFHVAVDGRFNLIAPLLLRVEALFERLAETMGLLSRIQVAHILAMGYYFLYADSDKVEHFSSRAWRWADENGLENLKAGIALIRGYRYAILGQWADFRRKVEQAHTLIRSPRVSPFNKLFLSLMQVNHLSLEGDFDNYSRHRESFQALFEKDLIVKTTIGPLLWVLDIDRAIITGEFAEAMDYVRQGLASGYAAGNPHLRSQYQQYHAFLLAREGAGEEALAAAGESRALRGEAGGRLFEAVNLMILGAAHVQLQLPEQAEAMLGQAIVLCRDIGEKLTRAGALAYRGVLRLDSGRPVEALEDLREALRLMRKHGFAQFFVGTPQLMEQVLSVAVKHDIEPEYVRTLAAGRLQRGLLADGTLIPLLNIETLGLFTFCFDGELRARQEDFSPAQRQLLALLVSSRGGSLSQENVQLALWPESPPEKSRSNFDTLLSRLRKALEKTVAPYPVKYYLALRRGMLCLENCRIDAWEFSRSAEQGLAHWNRQEPWLAGNPFYRCQRLWQGGYLEAVAGADNLTTGRGAELERLFLDYSVCWARLLADAGTTEKALAVLYLALKVDPIHAETVKALYTVHIDGGDPIRADRVVNRYRQVLAREAYSDEEIDEIVELLWRGGS